MQSATLLPLFPSCFFITSPCSRIEIKNLKAWTAARTQMGYSPTSHNMASSFVRVCALVRIRNDLASLLSSLYARRHPQMSAPSKARDRTFVEYSVVLISLVIIGCSRKSCIREPPATSTRSALTSHCFWYPPASTWKPRYLAQFRPVSKIFPRLPWRTHLLFSWGRWERKTVSSVLGYEIRNPSSSEVLSMMSNCSCKPRFPVLAVFFSVFTDHTLAHPLNCRGGVVARLSA